VGLKVHFSIGPRIGDKLETYHALHMKAGSQRNEKTRLTNHRSNVLKMLEYFVYS